MSTNPASVDIYSDSAYRKPLSKRTNPLLVKPITGQVKPSTYDLPPSDFTFGRRDRFDAEGVREVVGSWKQHTPNPEQPPGRDFVRMNRVAVESGAVTSKDIAEFRHTHEVRLASKLQSPAAIAATTAATTKNSSTSPKPSTSTSIATTTGAKIVSGKVIVDGTRTNALDPSLVTYGRPSKPSTPIHNVLNNTFQRNYLIDQQRIIAEQTLRRKQEKKKGVAVSGHTKASLGHIKIQKPNQKQLFKLEKFKNIDSKVQNYRGEKKGTNKPKEEEKEESGSSEGENKQEVAQIYVVDQGEQ